LPRIECIHIPLLRAYARPIYIFVLFRDLHFREIFLPKVAPFITRVFKHKRWQYVVGEMFELNFLKVLRIPEVDFIMITNATEECIASYITLL
jgi:hypothetical protein